MQHTVAGALCGKRQTEFCREQDEAAVSRLEVAAPPCPWTAHVQQVLVLRVLGQGHARAALDVNDGGVVALRPLHEVGPHVARQRGGAVL